jgi:hypothetical protein
MTGNPRCSPRVPALSGERANAGEGLPQLVDAREQLAALSGKTPWVICVPDSSETQITM